jgi:hypothetical protein
MEVTVGESDEGGNEEVAPGEAPALAVAAAPEVGGECHGITSAGTTKSSKMSRKVRDCTHLRGTTTVQCWNTISLIKQRV